MEIIEKFSETRRTASGDERAYVEPRPLKTLWFNTGSQCNIECRNCYIESSPRNDRLVYLTLQDVIRILDETESEQLGTEEIGFTGGEPFLNAQFVPMLIECLKRGYSVLVLTNAMKPLHHFRNALLELDKKRLHFRVSLDHYNESKHAEERGEGSWAPAMEGLQWLSQNEFKISVAGRTVWGETESSMREGYGKLFREMEIAVNAADPEQLVLFPEMEEAPEVPEISTACWEKLQVHPSDMMCASSRTIVRRKGNETATVAACTIIPYDLEFDFGPTLKGSLKPIYLNHPNCAKFCVLGGGHCSGSS